jgi:serine/threonine protein phosphatase 1
MMLQRLFGSRRSNRPGRVPAGEVVYAVGDVHGRLDLMQELLGLIAEDAARHPADTKRSLVFLGDYIDRGSESRGVVDALMRDPLPGFATVRLMGNHEQAFLAFLDGHSDGSDWLTFGGLETLLSYGVPLRSMPRTEDAVSELRLSVSSAVPKSHVDFMRRCILHCTIGDYLFVHAGVRPGVPLEKQSSMDLMWIRDDFLRSRSPMPQRVVVHGHTICDLPEDRGHRVNIDTGAFASGHLTCLALRERDRTFIST